MTDELPRYARSYEAYTSATLARLPLDKAMEALVGGDDSVGDLELVVLDHFGLRDGQFLVDIGCGSGRLARRAALLPKLRYLGTDVSGAMVDYARQTCSRPDFAFVHVSGVLIPLEDSVADIVAFFSVGTHLLNEEFFVYLSEARRVLRPGGRIVLSFLDISLEVMRSIFIAMTERARAGKDPDILNIFFTADTVRAWAKMLDMTCHTIIPGNEVGIRPSPAMNGLFGRTIPPFAFGQSLAVLGKPFD